MLITIQYTIADIRQFIDDKNNIFNILSSDSKTKDKAPNIENFKFVRSTGKLKETSSINRFFNDNDFYAKKVFKINKWLSFAKNKKSQGIEIDIHYRNFYYNRTLVTGIYEICFCVTSENKLDIEKLVSELLSLEIRISKVFKDVNYPDKLKSDFSEKDFLTTLGRAKSYLVIHYQRISSKLKANANDKLSENIYCSNPIIFIKHKDDDNVQYSKKRIIDRLYTDKIVQYEVRDKFGADYKAWSIVYNENNFKDEFTLTSFLEILSIRFSINKVLENINNETICPKRGSMSDNLQMFLIESFKYLDRVKEEMSKSLIATSIINNINTFNQSCWEQLETKLKDEIIVRPNVYRKVVEHLKLEIKKPKPNKLISSLFYIAIFILVFSMIFIASKVLDPVLIPIIILGTAILYSIIGAFILMTSKAITEDNFLTLMKLSFSNIPYLFGKKSSKDNGEDITPL